MLDYSWMGFLHSVTPNPRESHHLTGKAKLSCEETPWAPLTSSSRRNERVQLCRDEPTAPGFPVSFSLW